MNRREFLHTLAVAAAGGALIGARDSTAAEADAIYDVPRTGNVHLLHYTDCHAQIQPTYFREPNFNIGVGFSRGQAPHLVGDALLKHFRFAPNSREAYAFTHLDFARAANTYG